jgi:hypothetical protein
MPVVRCPKCGKIVSGRFPYHLCEPVRKTANDLKRFWNERVKGEVKHA